MSTSYLFSVLRNFAFFLILTQESLDGNAFSNYNMKCCYGKYIRPWRSWISQQIPILKAGGSNPSGRTKRDKQAETSLFVSFYPTNNQRNAVLERIFKEIRSIFIPKENPKQSAEDIKH
jgi:hypothetical protein